MAIVTLTAALRTSALGLVKAAPTKFISDSKWKPSPPPLEISKRPTSSNRSCSRPRIGLHALWLRTGATKSPAAELRFTCTRFLLRFWATVLIKPLGFHNASLCCWSLNKVSLIWPTVAHRGPKQVLCGAQVFLGGFGVRILGRGQDFGRLGQND